jgi:predicted PurR-regulated permease PerM
VELRLGVGSKALVTIAALFVVAVGMKWAESLIVPLLVAAFVAASTAPIVRWLCKAGVPTFLAVTGTILVLLLGLSAFAALTSIAASDLASSLPRLEQSMAATKRDVADWLAGQRLSRFAPMVMRVDPGELSERVIASLVLSVPDAASSFGVVLFLAVFLLLEAATLQSKLARAFNWQSERFTAVRNAIDEIQKYLLAKTWLSAMMGVLCGAYCALLGVDNPVLWGLVTFALNYVPVFGAFIATIGPVGMAALELGAGRALIVLAGLLVIHNVIGNVVEPKVFGRTLGLSPLVVVLAIVTWGWILGPVGALLSVPLTMVLKIVLSHVDDLKWLAILLGAGDGRETERYVQTRRPTGSPTSRVSPPAGGQSSPPLERSQSAGSSASI